MCEKMTFVKLLPRAQYSIFRLTIRSDDVGVFLLFKPPCFQCVYMSMILSVKKKRQMDNRRRQRDRQREAAGLDRHTQSAQMPLCGSADAGALRTWRGV